LIYFIYSYLIEGLLLYRTSKPLFLVVFQSVCLSGKSISLAVLLFLNFPETMSMSGNNDDKTSKHRSLLWYAQLPLAFIGNILVSCGVVSLWRGVWYLVGIYLFPEDNKKSTWVGFLIGVGAIAFFFLIQPYVRRLFIFISGKSDVEDPDIRWPRLIARGILYRLYLLGIGIAVVLVWRGIWQFWDEWVLTNDVESSSWAAAGTGLGILLFTYSLSSFVGPPAFHFNDRPKFAFAFNVFNLKLFVPRSLRQTAYVKEFELEESVVQLQC